MSDTTIDTNVLCDKIVRILKTIYDPEIPVSIYDLGLIFVLIYYYNIPNSNFASSLI